MSKGKPKPIEVSPCPTCGMNENLVTDLRRRVAEAEEAAKNSAECSACLTRANEPICMYCSDCFSKQVARAEAAENRVAALEAIVDKTADGVPIQREMTLWFRNPNDGQIESREYSREDAVLCHVPDEDCEDEMWEIRVSDCYSTREAAEAAKAARGPRTDAAKETP